MSVLQKKLLGSGGALDQLAKIDPDIAAALTHDEFSLKTCKYPGQPGESHKRRTNPANKQVQERVTEVIKHHPEFTIVVTRSIIQPFLHPLRPQVRAIRPGTGPFDLICPWVAQFDQLVPLHILNLEDTVCVTLRSSNQR